MTMHLLGPEYTTTQTRKRKQKFASAEEKRQYMAYQEWKEELKKSTAPAPKKRETYKPDYSFVRETPYYPSVDTGIGQTPAKEARVYAGERTLLGIATLHKSNAVPVFSQEDAESISKMRRG
jgi:hypothetical protein